MHVWNPQLEQHLETFDKDDEGSAADAVSLKDDGGGASESNADTERKVDKGEVIMFTVHRLLSRSIMEWISVGFIAVCCVVGSNGAVSLWRVSMLLLVGVSSVKWIVWHQKQSVVKCKQQHELMVQDCRIKLSSLLGSVGAPPLQRIMSNDENAANNTAVIDVDFILNYATTHVVLLKEVDFSLDMLRTGVSMSLRSAPRSVERVELACLAKNYHANTPVILPTARRMLCQVMIQHYNTVTSLLQDEEEDSVEKPDVITLAWLKSLRLDLGDLLSFQLSRLMSSPQVLSDVTLPDTTLRQCMHASIVMAKESTEYLASMFSTSQTNQKVNSDWNMLCRQFDKASVALCACQLSPENSNNGTSTKQCDDAQVLEFLEHFECLLHSVGNVKERLLSTTGVCDDTCEQNDTMSDSYGSNNSQPMDTGDYEHSGMSFDGAPEKNALHHENKTVVFSGSGSVLRPALDDGGDVTRENDTTLPNQSYITSQGIVLHELQQRLAQMPPAEEVGANGKNVVESETESTGCRRKEQSTTSMFLGVSGNLLSELKHSISNQDDLLHSLDSS